VDKAVAELSRYSPVINDSSLDEEAKRLRDLMAQKPITSIIPKLPPATDSFIKRYRELFEQARQPLLKKIVEMEKEISRRMADVIGSVNTGLSDEILQAMSLFKGEFDRCDDILRLRSFENGLFELRDRLNSKIQAASKESENTTPVKEKTLLAKQISAGSWRIETVEDLDRFIEAFRRGIAEKLETGTVIRVDF
ncbi:MAG: hypothetical protein J6S75_05110, partial [Thermoguttaceae bacterium]|nr:hypothetical protein [Thermoguttaceae bacterium]